MQDAVDKRLGSNVVRQGYGLTEATMAVFMSPLNCSKSGSSGKLVPGMMCKASFLNN
jgi:long-subunit acyl-CoA synthetase (AMP-forming)